MSISSNLFLIIESISQTPDTLLFSASSFDLNIGITISDYVSASHAI